MPYDICSCDSSRKLFHLTLPHRASPNGTAQSCGSPLLVHRSWPSVTCGIALVATGCLTVQPAQCQQLAAALEKLAPQSMQGTLLAKARALIPHPTRVKAFMTERAPYSMSLPWLQHVAAPALWHFALPVCSWLLHMSPSGCYTCPPVQLVLEGSQMVSRHGQRGGGQGGRGQGRGGREGGQAPRGRGAHWAQGKYKDTKLGMGMDTGGHGTGPGQSRGCENAIIKG